jgi:hypothetical protein
MLYLKYIFLSDEEGNLTQIQAKSCLSRTLKVRGGIIAQAHSYLSGFCPFQGTFPPQIIQVLLLLPGL